MSPSPPIPSICDVLWLSLYPASYLGVAMLARRHWRGIPAGVWLDGIVAGLAIAAVGAALVFGPVLRSATGSAVAVATNLAYPVADLLLAALVVGVLSLRGWRLDRGWALLGGGFLVLTVADSIYLTQVAGGSAASSNVANLFYMAGVALLALAAWQPPERSELPRTDGLSTLLVPGGVRPGRGGRAGVRPLQAPRRPGVRAVAPDRPRRAAAHRARVPRPAHLQRGPPPGGHRRPDRTAEPSSLPAAARGGDRPRRAPRARAWPC